MATGNLQPKDRAHPAKPSGIPPLRHGDRLSREEFERRCHAMPAATKAELIEGRVQMPSPVRIKSHGDPHHDIGAWLGVYKAFTPGVSGSDNASVRLDAANEPQPDIHLRIDESHGGQARISPDDYLEGAPELAAEVASSSLPYDLTDKKRILPPEWRAGIHRVARFRATNYLVRIEGGSISINRARPGWHPSQPRLSRPLAGCRGNAHRQFGDRVDRAATRTGLARTRRVRRTVAGNSLLNSVSVMRVMPQRKII
jgi:Uma2 family endonuclease